MLTFFTTAKPFMGHNGIIQRNALKSWKLLHPEIEVILFGSDAGSEQVCHELGLRYEPDVERSPLGTVRADSLFSRAQEIARHDLLCYVNCDIVLTREFCKALELLHDWGHPFLMIGRRWDTVLSESIDFFAPDWEAKIVKRAKTGGIQRFYNNIDYFAFPRWLYREMPPLVVGRTWWDHWMVWKALDLKCGVVDASDVICAVHQNHDYSHVPEGWRTVSGDEDARRNFELAKGYSHQRTIEDATFRLTCAGIQSNPFHWLAPTKRRVRGVRARLRSFVRTALWHPLLNVSRPIRHAIGLKQENVPAALRRGERRHELDQ
jgi:hypothetical protein